MRKYDTFFENLEKETFELMSFKEHLVESHFPRPFEEHELDYFRNSKLCKLEEDLIKARDLIERDLNASERHKNIVDFLENLLDDFYKI